MKAPKKLSVIVPTYNRRPEVARLLSALSDQSLSPDDFEVVVAIDGSLDGTQKLVDEFCAPYRLQAVWQKNAGRAAACNAGAAHARSDLLLFLDDDMEPAHDCLANHCAAHRHDERQAVIGSIPLSTRTQSVPLLEFLDAKVGSFLARLSAPGYRITPRDFFSSNFSICRDLFFELGGFDAGFRIYGNEDVEFAFRLLAAGVPIVFRAEAEARQSYNKTFAQLARDSVNKGRTAVLVAQRHPEARRALGQRWKWEFSRKWRLLRSFLLALPRAHADAPRWTIRLINYLERRRSRTLRRLYPFTLNYLFWLGVRAAMREESAGQESAYGAADTAGAAK